MGCGSSKGVNASSPAQVAGAVPADAQGAQPHTAPAGAARRLQPASKREKGFPIFLTFRVAEARTHALALKAALEKEGYGTFCSECDIPRGTDWIRGIGAALAQSQLVVVLATPTYGSPGTDAFATGEELAIAKKENKDLYVIPMGELEDYSTKLMLGRTQRGIPWTATPDTVPKELLEDLLAVCEDCGLRKEEDGEEGRREVTTEQEASHPLKAQQHESTHKSSTSSSTVKAVDAQPQPADAQPQPAEPQPQPQQPTEPQSQLQQPTKPQPHPQPQPQQPAKPQLQQPKQPQPHPQPQQPAEPQPQQPTKPQPQPQPQQPAEPQPQQPTKPQPQPQQPAEPQPLPEQPAKPQPQSQPQHAKPQPQSQPQPPQSAKPQSQPVKDDPQKQVSSSAVAGKASVTPASGPAAGSAAAKTEGKSAAAMVDGGRAGAKGLDKEGQLQVRKEEREAAACPSKGEEGEKPGDKAQKEKTAPQPPARLYLTDGEAIVYHKEDLIDEDDKEAIMRLFPENFFDDDGDDNTLDLGGTRTLLLARADRHPTKDLSETLQRVKDGGTTMKEAVGPVVGAAGLTMGSNNIRSHYFEFDIPTELKCYKAEECMDLLLLKPDEWDEASKSDKNQKELDPQTLFFGLLSAICAHASENGIKYGFCMPQPHLLERWSAAGVHMRKITGNVRYIRPETVNDYKTFSTSTVAYFIMDELRDSLRKLLMTCAQPSGPAEKEQTPDKNTQEMSTAEQEEATKAAITKSKFRRGLQPNEEETPDKNAQDDMMPKMLARFRVNTNDTLAVYKAISKEDYQDVVNLLPEITSPSSTEKMTYLLARLELNPNKDLNEAHQRVANKETAMNEAVGPAVGCLMATFGTNMISSCIFDFDDPEELKYYDMEERIELWGLQIPHTSARPPLEAEKGNEGDKSTENVTPWTSIDRLNMSIGLLFALCTHTLDNGIKCGFSVPRPQLLNRWLQEGVCMRRINSKLRLIYPESAPDYEYYRASTVAYFMVNEVRDGLKDRLALLPLPTSPRSQGRTSLTDTSQQEGTQTPASNSTSKQPPSAAPPQRKQQLPFGEWFVVRLTRPMACNACKGTKEQPTIDGQKEVFKCNQTLQPKQLAVVMAHEVMKKEEEGGGRAPKTWVFCPDPLCLESEPEGSKLPPWPAKIRLHDSCKISRQENFVLKELGLGIAGPAAARGD